MKKEKLTWVKPKSGAFYISKLSKRFSAAAVVCVLLFPSNTGMVMASGTNKVLQAEMNEIRQAGTNEVPQTEAEGLKAAAEKSENYRIVAEMAELDRNVSVGAYNSNLNKICRNHGKDINTLLADASEEIGKDDPLYSFFTTTLAYSSSELFADIMGGNENPNAYGNAVRAKYGPEPVREDYYTDEEWACIKKQGPDLIYMANVMYVLDYNIADQNAVQQKKETVLF